MNNNLLCIVLCCLTLLCVSPSHSKQKSDIANNTVMTKEEFKQAINNSIFFKRINKTIDDEPFDQYELKMIQLAIKNQGHSYGGTFQAGREIKNFRGDTLVVGGGKLPGKYSDNQGKTVLINNKIIQDEINTLITNLLSGKWSKNPYTGHEFVTKLEKNQFIQKLRYKQQIFSEAFSEWNKDILNRFYTINIDSTVGPDMIASINSELDTSKIPDSKFEVVEFENVPCDVYLNPNLYKILERITKPGGIIKLSVTNCCRRLMAPVIAKTKFSKDFDEELQSKHHILESMHPTYHRITFTVKN